MRQDLLGVGPLTAARAASPAGSDPPAGAALARSVAQVVGRSGKVAGAGFLVADDLLVTCAHVLAADGHDPCAAVELTFPRVPGAPTVAARAIMESWRGPAEQDVVLLRLDQPVPGTAPLALGTAVGVRGHSLRSLGFPEQALRAGHFGFAIGGDLLPAADETGELLQLTDANGLTTGFSGGPVLDEVTGLVVGMFSAITAPDPHGRGKETGYATPTSVLREIWPELAEHDVLPYRALEPFAAEHARWFRGREEAVERVLARMADRRRAVLLLGPSGAGKSSLVQAGVLPALAAGELSGSGRWLPVVVRPGPDPLEAFAAAGLTGVGEDGLAAAADRLLNADPAYQRVVLVVDQFEELLTRHEDGSEPSDRTRTVLEELTSAIGSDTPLTVLLVMRDDFYSRLSVAAPDLLDLALPGLLNVPATLTRSELTAIVAGPAGDLGVRFEPGLVERIVADAIAAGARSAASRRARVTVLPLLEVALSRLWQGRAEHDGRLTHEAYRRLGGITGALTDWCDSALAELAAPAAPAELGAQRRAMAQRVLTALVRPADGRLDIPAVRQQLPLAELRELAGEVGTRAGADTVDEVLATLARRRIISVHADGSPGPEGGRPGDPVAELIHDALIRDWEALRGWVEQDARFHEWLLRARSQHARWQAERNPQDLPAGTLLAEGTDWARQHRLPAELEAFLAAGRRYQQTGIRRSRRLNAALVTVLVLALLASGLAWQQRGRARAQTEVAEGRQYAAQAKAADDPFAAVAWAVAAQAKGDAVLPEARQAFARAQSLLSSWTARPVATLASDGEQLRWAPDGGELWTVGIEGLSRISLRDGHVTHRDDPLPKSPALSSWSADGARTARIVPDGTGTAYRAFEVRSGVVDGPVVGPVRAFPATDDGHNLSKILLSPDGRWVATVASDNRVRLWSADTGQPLGPDLVGAEASGRGSLTWSANGEALAIPSKAGLWIVRPGRGQGPDLVKPVTGADDPVVAWAPDGSRLATGGTDGTVQLRDGVDGHLLDAPLAGLAASVIGLAFDPSGDRLAGSSGDDGLALWDLKAGAGTRPATVQAGSPVPVYGRMTRGAELVWSPDGTYLARAAQDLTVRADGTNALSVRVWRIAAARPVRQELPDGDGGARGLAWNPQDGRLAAVTGRGATVVWASRTARRAEVLPGITGHSPGSSVAWNPRRQLLATAGREGIRTRTPGGPSSGPDPWWASGGTEAVSWSPDGERLASAMGDGRVLTWSSVGRVLTPELRRNAKAAALTVSWSSDGARIAVGYSDGVVQLWDAATSSPVGSPWALSQRPVRAVAWAPGGGRLATGSGDGIVRIHRAEGGPALREFAANGADVTSVAWSPDASMIAVGDDSGGYGIWDVGSGLLLGRTQVFDAGAVASVAWSPDGAVLAVGSADGRGVRLYGALTEGQACAEVRSAAQALPLLAATSGWPTHVGGICAEPDRIRPRPPIPLVPFDPGA